MATRIYSEIREVNIPLTNDTAAYGAGDMVDTIKTITGVRGTVQILHAVCSFITGTVADVDLYFFNADPSSGSTFTNNATIAIADAQVLKTSTIVTCLSSFSQAGQTYLLPGANNVESPMEHFIVVPQGSSSMYMATVMNSTPTFTGTQDANVKLILGYLSA